MLSTTDIPITVNSFQKANWPKPISLFEEYLKEQKNGERVIWVAYFNHEFVGYITLKFRSKYPSFLENNIPKINNFNVLSLCYNKGIVLALLKTDEDAAATKAILMA